MRYLLDSIKLLDLIKSVNARRKASMETEDLLFNHSSQRQVVKKLCEALPNICIAVFAQTLVIESVHLCDLAALVITA